MFLMFLVALGQPVGCPQGFMHLAEDLSPALITSWGSWRE